ncbi:MAG TPA: hypothetical protein VFK44_13575 [Bacillales bacterium]|nr:hypothetical protein [Bacillales bacterium]
MERQGVPACAVLTEPFVASGKAMALAQGFPDYPFTVMEHPISAAEPEELEARAKAIVDEVCDLLVRRNENDSDR